MDFKNNCIIYLQETHLNDTESKKLENEWKLGSITSAAINNSGGVAILYNETYFDEIISTYSHPNGRICSFTAKKDDYLLHFLNIYAPNRNVEKMLFFEQIEEHLWETMNDNPNAQIILAGDFNIILNPDTDSINRLNTDTEKKTKDYLLQIMRKFNLVDSYRLNNKYGGFTWGRDNPEYIRSRLDMIWVSKILSTNILTSTIDNSIQESDHKW